MDHREDEINIREAIQVALSIAARRQEILLSLREALKADDVARAIKLAKELCGIDEQERH
jgi:hypothetical protein